jgi:hypothetical protein
MGCVAILGSLDIIPVNKPPLVQIAFFLGALLFVILLKSRIAKSYRSQKAFTERVQFTFSDDKIEGVASDFSGTYKWSAI